MPNTICVPVTDSETGDGTLVPSFGLSQDCLQVVIDRFLALGPGIGIVALGLDGSKSEKNLRHQTRLSEGQEAHRLVLEREGQRRIKAIQ